MIADTAWMTAGDEPIVSMHGDQDDVVPYGTDMITVGGFYPIFVVDGSATITIKADQLGLDNCFYTYAGAGHTPHINGGADLEKTINFVSNFMSHLVCGGSTTCSILAATDQAFAQSAVTVSPNPSVGNFSVKIEGNVPAEWAYSLMDVTGRVLQSGQEFGTDGHRFDRAGLAAGIYLLRVNADGFSRTQRIVLQ
jgi:hypothetical protein